MNGRFGAVLRAIGALALSLGLIVGIPLLLIATVGNPLPSSIPSFDEIETVLTQNGQGFSEFIISALAVIVWFVWAQLVVAFGVEVFFAARSRETPTLPTAPGIQGLAARLVAAMTLATTLAVAPLLAPAAGSLNFDGPVPAVAVVDVAVNDVAVNDVVPSAATTQPGGLGKAPQNQGVPEPASVVVAPAVTLRLSADTDLWDLSEAAYGDGVKWKLIAGANAGVRDSAGAVITNETEIVPAGTQLELPGDASGATVAAFGTALDADYVVEPGDSMWSLAETEVSNRLGRSATESETAEYWFDVVDANDHVSSGDADLIYPGETLTMPGAGTPVVEPATLESMEPAIDLGSAAASDGLIEEAETPAAHDRTAPDDLRTLDEPDYQLGLNDDTTLSEDLGESPADSQVAAESTQSPDELPAAQLAVAAVGTALFASGVVAAISRRRDLQRRMRAAGQTLPIASTEAAQLELALRHRSSQVLESAQGNNWRLLPAQAVVDLRDPSPRELRTNLASPTEIVEPESPGVAVAEDAELGGASLVDIAKVAPGSLIVGTDPITGEAVLLDLERASLVNLIGSTDDVRRFAQSAVLDLAVSDRAADLRVVAVALASGLEDLERVQCVDSMAAALLAAINCGHTPADPTDDDFATPLVVVATADPVEDLETVDALVELGAIVLGPGLDAEVRITLNADRAHIWPTGSTAIVAALANDEFNAAVDLVESTELAAVGLPGEVDDAHEVDDGATAESDEKSGPSPEPGPLELQVLGPVEVVGASPFSSVKAVDVIAYLAFHRNGVDADQIKTWVWPGFDPPTNKAFANVMSRARAGLGVDDDGEPYLSKAGADKTYRLAAAVTTDFERFGALVALADAADDDECELEYLRQALSLIRGVPFTGGSSASFAWADNHVRAHVEFTIDEAVHRCADLALRIHDLATARWASLKGLELVPGCEQCFRRRFRVAGAGGNRSELRRAMADLERVTAAELGEPEAVDMISGDLLELYHDLDQQLVAGSSQGVHA